jgi:hypothetical protein
VFETPADLLGDWASPPPNGYDRRHGR